MTIGLLTATSAEAAVSFGPGTPFGAGGQTNDLVVGDFNGDGRPDVATASESSGTVSVLLGDGQGKLGGAATYSAGGNPTEIATGDFDNDGRPDLAVSNNQQGSLAWLRNLPGGTFGPAQAVTTPGPPVRVAAGDVNGDGFDDLASSDFGPDFRDLSVELSDGAGGFGAPIAQTTNGTDFAIVLADVNGNARADAILADGAAQTVSVLPGNPDGSLGPARSFDVGSEAARIAVADFDGDGDPDLAVGHQAHEVSVLLGNGAGGFAPQQTFATASEAPVTVVAADFDGDGRQDLGAGTGGFETMRGTGTGSFEAPQAHQPPSGFFLFTTADLDSDGAPDIVGVSGPNVIVRLNTSTQGPPPLPQPTVAKTANVEPVTGTVRVKKPGSNRFVRLVRGNQIPIGSLVDTTRGSVRLTTAASGDGGRIQKGTFRGGLFKLKQKRATRPTTELRLAGKLRCAGSRDPVRSGAARARSRRLFGNAHGRFRTRGRNSTASIRGTRWLVKDTCRTTLTRAQRGTVVVRDLVKHETITLRTGQSYLARRGNR